MLAKWIVKMNVPNTYSVIWRAQVIATSGYQGNLKLKSTQ